MAGIVWVLPSIDPEWRHACLGTLAPEIAERTLTVDNTVRNRGVAGSWNLGRARAINARADWLVLLSESMRFGDPGGRDWETTLREADPVYDWVDGLFGWHLIGFRRTLLERVGAFDENFYPAYSEDSDYLIRMHLAGYASPRENNRPRLQVTGIDATHMGFNHNVDTDPPRVKVDFGAHARYWRSKWGTEPPKAATAHPFGDGSKHWTWWPSPRPR